MGKEEVDFRKIAISGGFLMGAAQGWMILTQFASVIIMARLLMPEDFGLIASVSPILGFIGLFQNLGLQQAVVQRKDISDTQLNHIFWMTFLACGICFIIMASLSPFIADFYEDDRLTAIAICAAIPAFLFGMSGLPLALLNRELQFKTMAIIEIIGVTIGFLSAIIAALLGMAYWSILIGAGSRAIANLGIAWFCTKWKPTKPDFKIEKEILNFGANMTGFNFVNYVARNIDNILIGKYIGTVALGYYDRAYKLLLFPIQNINNPLSKVMLPILSKVQDDPVKFRKLYIKSNGFICLILVPGITALTIIPDIVITFFFGERWLPVAPIFQWLGIIGLIQPLSNTTGWIFIALGRADTMFKLSLIRNSVIIGAFFWGIQYGAIGVAMGYALSGIFFSLPILFYACHKISSVTIHDFLGTIAPYVLAAGITYEIAQQFILPLELWNLWSIILITATSYIASIATNTLTDPGRETQKEMIKYTILAINKAKSLAK